MTDAIGIVVVHFGDAEPTHACLRSIAGDRTTWERQIVVIDNSVGELGPVTSGLLREAAAPIEVEVVRCPGNPGFGGGANRGVERILERGGAAFYLILNHDVELLPGFSDAVAAALGEEGVGAAGGPIRTGGADGPLWYAGGAYRPLTGLVTQSRSEDDAAIARDVGFVPAAAIALSCTAWEEVGGFDAGFFLYHEDLDLCLRLLRSGWRLRFEPGMRAVHHVGGATGSGRRSALYLKEMASTRLRPHPSKLYRLYLAAVHTPYVLLRATAIFAGDRRSGAERAAALLRGHGRALRSIFR